MQPRASAETVSPLRLDLALVDDIGERTEGLVDVTVGVGLVDLVEVDPIGVQAPQGVLDAGMMRRLEAPRRLVVVPKKIRQFA